MNSLWRMNYKQIALVLRKLFVHLQSVLRAVTFLWLHWNANQHHRQYRLPQLRLLIKCNHLHHCNCLCLPKVVVNASVLPYRETAKYVFLDVARSADLFGADDADE
jgi:hypothetical protein